MKKIFLLLLFCVSFLSAEINEYASDVYYANGVDTQKEDADESLRIINKKFKLSYPKEFKSVKNWTVSLNHTQGMGIDLYEAMLQKIEEDWKIKYALDATGVLKFTYGGIAKMVAKKVAKEKIEEFAQKQAAKIAKKIFIKYKPGNGRLDGYTQATVELLFQKVFEKIIDDLIMQVINIPEEDIKRKEQADIKTQFAAYTQSIKDGHGVVVIAHSQGNLFTNVTYDMFTNHWLPWNEDTEWMRRYFSAFAVASPANDILGQSEPHITFDNDIIGIVPNSLDWNIKNPTRYDFENGAGEKIDNIFSFEAHAFLTSYMKEDITREHILGFIRNRVDEQTYNKMLRPSQWKPKNLGCTCKTKYAKMTHIYDPDGMNQYLSNEKVKDFNEDEEGKIYKADAGDHAEYVRADNAERVATVEEVDSDEVCYVLKDVNGGEVGQIEGLKEHPKTKDGVVEISLEWEKPELDYDLIVEWDAGEVDVKDTGCPMEHFHIKSEMKIYPGTYRVSIVPKDPTDEGWEDPDLYPFSIDLITRTPGASDRMHFEVKNQTDIKLGHVSDIKVFRVDDDGSDDNETDPDPDPDPSGGGGEDPGGENGGGGFLIAPQPAPECPPVQHTPSPVPPKPIYFPHGGSGGWIWGACCGGSSGYGTGTGGVISGTGGYTPPPFTPQESPECGGDIGCLPTPTDGNNNGNNPDESSSPTIPALPEVGGRPLPDEDEDDNCTGDMSCGCIPCEYEIIPYKKQIYFGPLRDANFSIYSLDGYVGGESLFDGKTTNGNTLYDAGEIDVPQVFLNTLEDDKLYIIEGVGGEDIDRNDDFIVDANATRNLGKVYAIASGKDIKYTGFKINILTTVTFELLKQSIEDGDTQEEIEAKITEIASRLLRYKVYPSQVDSNITNVDLLAWLPTVDKDLLLQSYAPLEEMVGEIYAGENIYDKAYEYVFYQPKEANATNGELPFGVPIVDDSKPPIIRSFIKNISEDAEGGTLVGKIEILRGSEDIYFGELVGKGKEAFEVNDQGEIRLKDGVTLDYETKWLYVLQIEAFNKNGGSGFVAVYISVKNVLDAPEYVGYEGMIVDENITSGTKVGQLLFTQGASPITSMEMQGASKDVFTIDNNGTIRLAEGQTLDYEQKYSYGFVAVAKNSYGVSMPVILYINIRDIKDSPQITDYTGGYVHENAIGGTVVGQVKYDKGGAELDSISLDGNGSENFTIDLNGTVRVSATAVLDYESYELYRLTVTVSNVYGSATRRIPISVVNTNDVPSFVSFVGGNVKENAPIGTVAGKITFDAGSMPIDSIDIIGDGSEDFRVLENGTIVTNARLNYEEKNHYIVKIIATSAVGSSLPVTAHLFVDDVSEIPAVLEDFVVNNIEENLSVGTIIGHIDILNEGSSAIELFEITGNGSDKFSIDMDGNVTIAKALDFEEQEIHNLQVKAKNGAGFGNEVNFIVRLADVADVIAKIENITFDIEENVTSEVVVGQAIVLDSGDSNVTAYELRGNGSEKFDINSSGAISVKADNLFDYETSTYYNLQMLAHSKAGESLPASVRVNVLNIPDVVPVLHEGTITFRVDENSPENTLLGSINIANSGDSPIDTFVISGGGNENFYIDTNGTVKVSSNADLDYENIKNYTLKVKAHSAAGYSNEIELVVWVDNVPDLLPVLSYTSLNGIDENETQSIVVGKVTVTQSDTPITSMTLSGVGSEKFTIDSNGTLRTKEDAGFDYESEPSYVIYVLATSAAGNSEPLKVTIAIGNVEENPKLSTFSATIDENATAGTVVGKVNIIGHGDSPIVSMSLSGYGSNDFTIDSNGTIKVSDTAKLDYETTNSYALKVIATNKNGHSSSYAYNEFVRINLNNLPDEPVIELSGTYSVDENATEGTVIGKINIARSGDSPIDYFEFSYSNGVHVDNEGVITVGNNTILDYENNTRFYVYTRVVNKNGNKSNYLYIEVFVTNIPDEPVLKSQEFNVDENATIGTIVGKIEPIEEGDSPIVMYEIMYDYDEMFNVDVNGTITIKDNTNLDYENSHYTSFNIRAKNESGKYSKQVNVRVKVNNMPDEPIVEANQQFSIEENATAGTIVGELNITSAGDSPIKSIVLYDSYNDGFTIDNNGTIRVSDNANLDYENYQEYWHEIEVTNENGNTIYAEFVIALINIPDEPVLEEYINCSVEEHKPVGTKICQLGIVEEGDSPIVSIDFVDYNGLNIETPFSIDKNGTITVKDSNSLDYEKQNYYELHAVATNESGKKSRLSTDDWGNWYGSVFITLRNDPYDVPILERKTIYIDENSSVGTILGNVLVNEGKAAISEAITYKSRYTTYGNPSSSEVSKLFNIDLEGNIKIKVPLDYEKNFKPCQNNASSKRYCEYINVKMTNQYGSTTLYKQEIEIGDVPDTPPVLEDMIFEITENASVGAVVGQVTIVEHGEGAITHFDIKKSEYFTIDNNGTITLAQTIDYETQDMHELNVTATNAYAISDVVKVQINVLDIEDVTPTLNNFVGSIDENSIAGTVVGILDVENNGDSAIGSIILNGNGNENFTVETNGTIKVASDAVLDFENQSTYSLTAIANNQAGSSEPVDVNISINNIHQIILSDYSGSIEENSPHGTIVGKIDMNTTEAMPQSITLTGIGSEHFSIDENGTIRVSGSNTIDYERQSSYVLKAIAQNNIVQSNEVDIVINIINVPELPPKINYFSTYLAENSETGTIVGRVTIESETAIQKVSLSGIGSDKFTVDLNGTIYVAENAILDYEAYPSSYSLTIYVTNSYGISNGSVNIYLQNVPDTPPNVYLYGTLIVEDGQDNSRNVGNANDVYVWSDSSIDSIRLEGTGASDFSINNQGYITISNGVVIDINRTKHYQLTLIAENEFGESTPEEITINVHYSDYTLFDQHDKAIQVNSLVVDNQGNFYLGGTIEKQEYNRRSYNEPVIIKYDSDRNLVWTKNFEVMDTDEDKWNPLGAFDTKLLVGADNHLYLAGNIQGAFKDVNETEGTNEVGEKDIYIISLDTNGTTRWIKQFGTADDDSFVNMIVNNNKIFVGSNMRFLEDDMDNNISTNSYGVVYVLENNGTFDNVKQFDNTKVEKIRSFDRLKDNTGFLISSTLDSGVNIVKLDENLVLQSSDMIDIEIRENTLISEDSDGNTYFVDRFHGGEEENSKLLIHKYTSEGILVWSQEYEKDIIVQEMQIDSNGFRLIGISERIGRILEFDSQGELILDKRYGFEELETHVFILDEEVYLIEIESDLGGEEGAQ